MPDSAAKWSVFERGELLRQGDRLSELSVPVRSKDQEAVVVHRMLEDATEAQLDVLLVVLREISAVATEERIRIGELLGPPTDV